MVTPRLRAGRRWPRPAVASGAVALTAVLLLSCTSHPDRTPPTPTPSTSMSSSVPSATGTAPATDPPSPTVVATTLPTDSSVETEAGQIPMVSEPEATPATRTDELRRKIARHSGTVSLQDAIDVFTLSIAELPGATVTSVPPGPGFSVTEAMALIEPHRGSLTAAQRKIVDEYRGGDAVGQVSISNGQPVVSGGGADGPLGLRAAPTRQPTADQLNDLLRQTIADWNAHKSHVLAGYTAFTLINGRKQPPKKPTVLMSTEPDPARHMCTITVWPHLRKNADTALDIQIIFAHELFHCYQAGVVAVHPAGWLLDGSADWASYDLYRGKAPLGRRQAVDVQWFTDTSRALELRAYDAWPLYETYRQQLGGDPYLAIDAMLRKDNLPTEAILVAGGLDHPLFGSEWASATVRSTRTGDRSWQFDWPGSRAGLGGRDIVTSLPRRGVGVFGVQSLPNWTHRVYQVPLSSDVGVVRLRPTGGKVLTIADTGTLTVPEGDDTWLCTDPGKCPCPPDTEPVVDLIPATSPIVLAFEAKKRRSTAVVDAQKWNPKKFCQPREKRDRTGQSNGDPHIHTFDGLVYEAMHNGEFVTVTDPQGGLTVQERHEPLGFGAGNSAIAVGTGDHRVTVTTGGWDDKAVVRLDGRVVDAPTFTAGAVTVAADVAGAGAEKAWTFSWPDGSRVQARLSTAFFVTVTLPADRAGRAQGLLGNGNGSFLDDLAGPTAPVLDLSKLQDAWLVSSRTTLFDYEPGQTSESFRTPPPKPVHPTDAALENCRELLGSAATEAEIRSCAYDVTATGRDELGTAYTEVVQQRVDQLEPIVASTGTPPTAPSATPSATIPVAGTPVLTLEGTVGLPGTPDTVPSLTGTVRLTAGSVVIGRASCPEDPTLDVTLAVANAASSATLILCGTNHVLETYEKRDGDDTPTGEGYLLVQRSDDYTVTVGAGNTIATAVSVELFADAAPTVVATDAFPAGGIQGTLTGIGDTTVVWVGTGPGESPTYTLTGGAELCSQLTFGAVAPEGVSSLHGVCPHRSSWPLTPSIPPLPIVVFNRTGTATDFTLNRTG